MNPLDNPNDAPKRMQSDADREEEFKNTRKQLVADINAWLMELTGKRDKGEALPNGLTITDQPSLSGGGKQGGIILTGDGRTTRCELQVMLPLMEGAGVLAIQVKGTDPVKRPIVSDIATDTDHAAMHTAEVSYKRTREILGQPAQYFAYQIDGTGSVLHELIDASGRNTFQYVRTIEELRTAAAAFDQIEHDLS